MFLKVVLFDIDGTLLNGSPLHLNAFCKAVEEVYGVKVTLDFRVDGLTDLRIVDELLERSNLDKSKSAECLDKVVEWFNKEEEKEKSIVLPGVKELLEELKNRDVLIGLVTGNIEEIAWRKLEKAGIKYYFSFGGFGNEAKERWKLVRVAMWKARKFGFNGEEKDVFVVGDTIYDVEAGKKVGAKVIGVATGRFSKEELREAGADLVLNSLEEKEMFLEFVEGLI